MNTLNALPKTWLETEYKRRREKNPQYSLRAYASFLKIPPGRLSEILTGKRKITPRMASHIGSQLGLSPKQKKMLEAAAAGVSDIDGSGYHSLQEDAYAAISEWQHFAFLSLMDTDTFRFDVPWIAKRLKISTFEAREMIARLQRLDLVAISKKKISKTHKNLQSTNEISSAALRKMHRQFLAQAAEALENVPLEERDITSMTMAIDMKKLPLAKKLIRDFRFHLAELLENGTSTEVYNLNVQLVPLTVKEKINEKNN